MSRESVPKTLDYADWGRIHWYLFTAVSLNYLLDGVIFAIAPLIAVVVAPELATFIFASNLLAETLGAVFFGYLADKRGRKLCLILINLIQAISTSLLFFFYSNPLALWVLTSLLSLSVGGDFGASYAALAEIAPARYRGRAILLSTNFWNIGSTAIAGAALAFRALYSDPQIQTQYILLSALATLGLVAVIRLTVPESPRWLLHIGRKDEALSVAARIGRAASSPSLTPGEKSRPSNGFKTGYLYRFAILAVITISQYVTYGMMAYYAPYARGFVFGVESAPMVIFVANLGASVGAFILWPLIDRGRRVSTLLSFLLGTVTAALVLAAHVVGHPLQFYTALFVCLIFSEWAWGSVSALQSELFPTGIRATAVGVLTGLTGVSGAVVVLTQNILSASEFIAASVLIWGAGLAATVTWLIRGVETANRTVEELEAV
ncbi:MAG: MFS transporter [Nitrososphaerota archaeon]|nr:sugar porter family MFS transporter [Candidatus Calditenuaceae archaeon]MDW8073691.1 MFS transporter [Nitrososphaerota archaeon]